jgi:hypothetical protein
METTMKRIYTFIPAIILLALPEIMPAQVTIGCGVKPARCAILDVKSHAADGNNITSEMGGIVMPRLKLENPDTLEPIISNTDPDLDELKKVHTGLVVYNLTNNDLFKDGLYVWNGSKWEAIISNGANNIPVAATVQNGLSFTQQQGEPKFVELGGTLDDETTIDQDNHNMSFTTGNGSLSINSTDFVIAGGNTGIGKNPSPRHKLDISGDVSVSGNLRVEGEALLKDVKIGTSTSSYGLKYIPNKKREEDGAAGKFLLSYGDTGLAEWGTIGGLSSVNMDELPADTIRIHPNKSTDKTPYRNTGMSIELPHGKWMINYSVRMTSPAVTGTLKAVKPTSFRFTMLEKDGTPISTVGVKKPYDDCRAYPDTYYNSCTGFFIVENNSDEDKLYYLGIKTQEKGLNWPVSASTTNLTNLTFLINKKKNDAYLVAILMNE